MPELKQGNPKGLNEDFRKKINVLSENQKKVDDFKKT